MSNTNFPSRLRSARKRQGLSQAQLAAQTGLQPSGISHFESGRRFPSLHNFRKLADALDVATDYLLGRTYEPRASVATMARLCRYAEGLSQKNLESLASFAETLAAKDQESES